MDPKQAQEAMIKEWGLEKLSEEERDSFIERIGSLLYQSIILRAADDMSEADKGALDKYMIQHPDAEAPAILDFLAGRIINFNQLIAEETAKLKELLAPAVAA